jgi:hypothetical protein
MQLPHRLEDRDVLPIGRDVAPLHTEERSIWDTIGLIKKLLELAVCPLPRSHPGIPEELPWVIRQVGGDARRIVGVRANGASEASRRSRVVDKQRHKGMAIERNVGWLGNARQLEESGEETQ